MFKRIAMAMAMAVLLPSAGQAQVNCAGTSGGAFYASSFNWGTGISYVDCYGAVSGNDNGNQTATINSVWSSYGTFSLLGSSDGSGNGPFTSLDGSPLGFDSPLSGYFALTLKQASYFSVYLLFANTPVTSVNWDSRGVASNGGTQDPDKLSHAVLYSTPQSTTVPEPTSYSLIVAGLASLAFVSRRRRAKG
ncbi:MAG TPA: PEP-CTERM sorting domain-containing protein [Gemmatimonas sp.]|uniref:PEP-CTERM sorting domain-containing protein n=1 Tax=Gemmatimonas sp. TaxID=1962908 RepID=UPI002EDA7A27